MSIQPTWPGATAAPNDCVLSLYDIQGDMPEHSEAFRGIILFDSALILGEGYGGVNFAAQLMIHAKSNCGCLSCPPGD